MKTVSDLNDMSELWTSSLFPAALYVISSFLLWNYITMIHWQTMTDHSVFSEFLNQQLVQKVSEGFVRYDSADRSWNLHTVVLYEGHCMNNMDTYCAAAFSQTDMSVGEFWPGTQKGTFSLSNNTRQLLHSCLKFVWKSLRVKTAREKRPVAANSLTLQKSQEEELPWHGGPGVCMCVVPSVARRCGGESVSRLDGGWIQASGEGGGGGPRHSSVLTLSLRLRAAVK